MNQYYKCRYCNGTGETEKYTDLIDYKTKEVWMRTKFCIHCQGEGQLDWIENLVGKPKKELGNKILRHHTTIFGEGKYEGQKINNRKG